MLAERRDVRLYFFQCGVIEVPLRNINLGEGAGGEMVVTPVPWYLVTHPRGNIVIDGGNAPEVAVDARTHWGAITEMSTPVMSPDEAVVPAMEAAGFDPADVRWIVQTHLHLDHTGAVAVIERFPNAEVVVSRTEYAWAHAPASYAALGYAPKDYVKPGVPWVLLEQSEDGYDLLGDGTLRFWWTPGHTPGHASIEVNLPSGASFMLAVDAANTIDHLFERKLPAFNVSVDDAINSVRRLRRLAWRRDATIVAGHDPDQWPTLRKAPEYYD
jgi:glyoxylase-like metal-dependent hydrolase (beta-lactamase superfamily II)